MLLIKSSRPKKFRRLIIKNCGSEKLKKMIIKKISHATPTKVSFVRIEGITQRQLHSYLILQFCSSSCCIAFVTHKEPFAIFP